MDERRSGAGVADPLRPGAGEPDRGRFPVGGSRCSRCGAPFHCGVNDPGGCWCARLPMLPREAYAEGDGCLCEACLGRALQEARGSAADDATAAP